MTTQATTLTTSASGSQFDALVKAMQAQLDTVLTECGPALFVTEGQDLNSIYLEKLDAADRQHHTCSACRRFLQFYGALAGIKPDGTIVSALWNPDTVPDKYRTAVKALARTVTSAKIDRPILFGERTAGTPVTGQWTHFAIEVPQALVYHGLTQTRTQWAAGKVQDYGTLQRALQQFDYETVKQAVNLLEAYALYRSERFIGPARFLLELHQARIRAVARGPRRDAFVWRAVASAPPGFCQPASTMIGTLLQDISNGLPFHTVKYRFDAKMGTDRYQRPQAAPAAGTIAQAEKLVEQLGIASALRRRFARLEEVETIWTPVPPVTPTPAPGVFGHLQPREPLTKAPLVVPAQTLTWEKFARTVLPNADSIEVYCGLVMSLCAIVTAADPEARPILQWDREGARNPFSWYVYLQGSRPEDWNLHYGSWVPATAVSLQPSMWHGDITPHQGKGAIILLQGAADQTDSGLALFPEILRSDLHAVHDVIEAHSKAGVIEGREQASACGVLIRGDSRVGSGVRLRLRVHTDTGTQEYSIDRWD